MRRRLDPAILAIAVAAIFYGAFALWLLPPDVFYSGDCGVKLVQLESLRRQGYHSLSLVYPGAEIDPRGDYFPFIEPFAYRRDGRFLAGFPPAFSALSSFPAALLGPRGLLAVPLLSALALLLLLRWLCLAIGLGNRRTLVVVSIVAFASPLPFYAMVFWEHSLFALLIFAAIALAVPARNPGRGAWMLSGILLSLATWLRLEGYVFAAALVVVTILGRAEAAGHDPAPLRPLLAGIAAGIAPLWIFNLLSSGTVMGIGTRQLIDSPVLSWHRSIEQAAILSSLLFDRHHGLLFQCPWLALAPIVTMVRHPQRTSLLFLLAVALIALVGIAAGVPNAGGLQWGPRYLLPLIPIGAITSVEAVVDRRSSRRSWIGATLLVLLTLLAVRPALSGPAALRDRTVSIELPALEALRASPIDVCVFRNSWFGQGMASAWFEKQIFRVRYQADVEDLVRRLYLAGKRKFLLSDYRGNPYSYEAILVPAGEAGELMARRTGSFEKSVYHFEEWTITRVDEVWPSERGPVE